MSLANTEGIIDADYYNALNQGHIMIKVCNNSNNVLELLKDTGFCQGLFIEYFITAKDKNTAEINLRCFFV